MCEGTSGHRGAEGQPGIAAGDVWKDLKGETFWTVLDIREEGVGPGIFVVEFSETGRPGKIICSCE